MLRSLEKSRSRKSLAWLLVPISCCAFLCSCEITSLPTQEETGQKAGEISVAIRLSKIAAASISRAEVVVTGSGMTDIRQTLTVSSSTITGNVTGIPAGANRLFTLNGYDAAGNLSYTGSATATITAGQQTAVHITMVPTFQALGISAFQPYRRAGVAWMDATIHNSGSNDATGVVIRSRAMNSFDDVIVEATTNIGVLRAGESSVFHAEFKPTTLEEGGRQVVRVDCTISYNEGAPITATFLF